MFDIEPMKIKAIAINCCGLIGDALIRVPFIEKVASLFPNASIAVIVDRGREELFINHPDIDEVIVYNRVKKPRLVYLKNLYQLICHLRKEKFDIFFDLYSGGSSIGVTKFSKAKYRFGFCYTAKSRKAYTHPFPYPEIAQHWGQDFGKLLAPFNVQEKDLRAGTSFYPNPAAEQTIKTLLNQSTQAWVLFNMGAGDLKKTWPVENFVALAAWLHEQYDFHIGVFINPGQEFLATEFAERCAKNNFTAYTLLKLSNFSEIAYCLKQAKFFVTGDTGLLHLAFGVKANTVALFTYTRPEHVLAQDCCCIPCFVPDENLKDRNGRPLGCRDIPLELVKAACEKADNFL
jgi:ADP-heptose:LPS heptosyltransferase